MEKVDNKSIYHQLNQINKEKEADSKQKRAEIRQRLILILLFFIGVLSVINLTSASFYRGHRYFQGHGALMGMLYFALIIFIFIEHKLKKFIYRFFPILLNSSYFRWPFILIPPSILTFVGMFGKKNNGATGWVSIGGITAQFSEFFKIAYIVVLAMILKSGEEKKESTKKQLIKVFIITLFYAFPIIVLQNDTGTFLHYAAITIFMIFIAKIDKWLLLTTGMGGVTALIGGFYWVYNYLDTKGQKYAIQRIKAYVVGLIDGDYDSDISYQVGQGLIAFGNGGFLGKGYGNGMQKYSYLPEVHTDFISASFGEEFGFLGLLIMSLMFLGLFNVMMNVAEDAEDTFGKYVAAGVAGFIITQYLINIFVATGLLPVFGIPMPFFSHGGSSLLTVFTGIALVCSINNSIGLRSLTK